MSQQSGGYSRDSPDFESPDLLESPSSSQSRRGVRRHAEDESEFSPPARVRRVESDDVDDGQTCPICLEAWSNSGPHRLCSLKCGHLFGLSCVNRWLRRRGESARQACPSCNARATLRDVRTLYARRVVAIDDSQLEDLRRQVSALEAERSRAQLELHQANIAHRATAAKLEDMRTLLHSQGRSSCDQPARGSYEQPARVPASWRFALDKQVQVSREGGCRVLAYNCRTYELYASARTTNGLFPGYGVRVLSCVDYALGQFIHLHGKPIRDMCYSQPRDQLLVCALDGVARTVERGVASAGATVRTGLPLWSCAWDHVREHELYAGGVGGKVLHYDLRNPAEPLRSLAATGDLSPVVSLHSTEFGLLSCQLNSCRLWSPGEGEGVGEWESRPLPVEGSFMSLCYDEESRRAVVSTRPSGENRAKLTVCRVGSGTSAAVEETFPGSARASVLVRARVVSAGSARWVAAYSESFSSTVLHGLDGARSLSLASTAPTLDVASVQLQGGSLLAALCDDRLRIYRATADS